jgi:hypothetical protein
MKPTLLLGCALLAGTTLHAQLSFLPYAGIEQSRNTLNYGSGFSAAQINGHLKAGLRADYRFKTGHSPFINLTTNPAATRFSFDKAGLLLGQSQAGGMLFRMEAGYQYSSKPIQLGKKSSSQRSASAAPSTTSTQNSRCGSVAYRSSCGSKSKTLAAPPARNLNMRLQPSLALAYLPAAKQGISQTANGFAYTPGWKTALVPAMGFEFARGTHRLFTLGVFYTAPLGQKGETATTALESKMITTALQPRLSSWGFTLGLPFSFSNTKATKASSAKPQPKKSCTRTYYRSCSRLQ